MVARWPGSRPPTPRRRTPTMADDARVRRILAECREREERGETVDEDAVVAAHPEIATALRRAGVRRRPDAPRRPRRARHAARGAVPSHRMRGRESARRDPRRGRGPPRRQARERPPYEGPRREGDRPRRRADRAGRAALA